MSYDDATSHFPQSWNRYAYVTNMPEEMVDPAGLCGNLVVGGSTQSDNVFLDALALRLGAAQPTYPFAGQNFAQSMGTIEFGALGFGSSLAQVRSAIAAQAAAGPGNFTVYGFSGGAQLIQTALGQLGPAVASRAVVVGISPGYGNTLLPQMPSNALTVWGGGNAQDALVAGSAAGNWLQSGSTVTTGCGHDADCEVSNSWGQLQSMASPACTNQKSGGGGGGGAGGGGGGGYPPMNPFGGIDTGPGVVISCNEYSTSGQLLCKTYILSNY